MIYIVYFRNGRGFYILGRLDILFMKLKILFFIFAFLLLLNLTVDDACAFQDDIYQNWSYYKEITVKENSGKTLRDYPVLITFKPSDFMSSAEVDGSDLRFTYDDRELSYWIEEYNRSGMNAKVWVNVPRIPSFGESKIVMYYGNDRATKKSNGEATFQFFDGFEGDVLDENKWDIIDGGKTIVNVSDGKLFIEGRCFKCETDSGLVKVATNNSFKPPHVVEFKTSISHTQKDRGRGAWFGFSDDNIFASPKSWGENYAIFRLSEVYGSFSEVPMISELSTAFEGESEDTEVATDYGYRDKFNVYSIAVADGYSEYSRNYEDKVSHTTNVPISAMYGVLAVQAWDEGYGQYFSIYSYTDWFRIRKYASPEPTTMISRETENLNQESVQKYINSISEKIEEARSIGVDVTVAEEKLNDAKAALSQSNYRGAKDLADSAMETVTSTAITLDSIKDLKESASKYDGYTIRISGDIRGIETVGEDGYTFILDDSEDLISVVYPVSLIDVNNGDKVTIKGIFEASSGIIEADTVEKSGFWDMPGYEAVVAIISLLAIAYLMGPLNNWKK